MAFFNENEDTKDYENLIGASIRGANYRIKGEIVNIIAETTALSGTIVKVVLDTGEKIPVRRLNL